MLSQKSGALKKIGGSRFDDWNDKIIRDTSRALWTKRSDENELKKEVKAAIVGLRGIEPKDELEAMIAAQFLAAYNAAMECYRRAMIPDQTFESRQEALNQANKLSRTSVKGEQKVTVEHVHVYAGGQAVVGMIETPGGW
jgi:hypothetical protein